MQCVEHVVDFKMNKNKNGGDAVGDQYKINARDFFVSTQVMILMFMYIWSGR